MNRKHFLSSLVPAAISAQAISTGLAGVDKPILNPPYLQAGDTVGICSPAGYITLDEIQSAIGKLKEWGYQVRIGNTIGKRYFTFGGTDEERLTDLQHMMDDPEIKAILCARGGYGSVRIVDGLNFKKLKKNPKWIIGFSDITVFHCHLNRNYNIASIHSKMCNSFPDHWTDADPIQIETIESIHKCLSGDPMNYLAPANAQNKTGTATGPLVGGNLKTIESLSGSKSDIITEGKILFVEDTGEYLYSIDRMFWYLKRSGKLDHLKGLIIGGFKAKKDDAGDEFGISLEEIVLNKIKEFSYPVCFDFPVGHQRNNFALKCGMPHQLSVTANGSQLTQI